MKTPREVIAAIIWTRGDGTFSSTGANNIADSILSALKEAGWVCVPLSFVQSVTDSDWPEMNADEARDILTASQDQGRE